MSLISVPDEGSQHFQDRNDHPGEDHANLFLQKNNNNQTSEDLAYLFIHIATINQGKNMTIISYKKGQQIGRRRSCRSVPTNRNDQPG
jgi:hypothetical protein